MRNTMGMWGLATLLLVAASSAGCMLNRRAWAGPNPVTICEPQTLKESWEQRELLALDRRSREPIREAREAYSGAQVAYNAVLRAFLAPPREGAPPPPTEEEVEAVRRKMEMKWYALADLLGAVVDRYEEFLLRYPHNWYVRHRYAWFLADVHMNYEAAVEWRRVIAQAPDFPYAYNNLGSLYNHMGRDMEAVDLFRKAISLKDDDPTFHVNLAVNYSTHRDDVAEKFGWDLPRVFRECIGEYRRARELAPGDADIARDLATQYVLAKFFGVEDTADEAIEAWRYYLGLELTPIQRAMGLRNLGRIYLREKNDPAAALDYLEKSRQLLDNSATRTLLKQARAALGSGEDDS